MLFALHSIGCKANQAEMATLATVLTVRGHRQVDWDMPADAYVLNTCTVTAISDAKCRQAIRRLRRLRPGATLAVMGCLSQVDANAVTALGVDVVLGTDNKEQMPDRLELAVGKAVDCTGVAATSAAGRTRAFLKVQDGCSFHCSYCIIPTARGPARSLPLADVLAQVEALTGVREVVVTGIEISSWGADLPGRPPLKGLLTALCRVRPDIRFRLGSLEPRVVTDDWVAAMAALPNVCHHFHLPLQSGCDATLARMARRYNTQQYQQALARLRASFPDAAVTTDFMVGFPGEDDAEWASSLDFFSRCSFADAHIFPYSRRAGTKAAEMAGQLTRAVKKERAARAAAAAAEASSRYAAGCVGSVQQVIFEERKAGCWQGHADNYSLVCVDDNGVDRRGQCLPVLIEGHDGAVLTGNIISATD